MIATIMMIQSGSVCIGLSGLVMRVPLALAHGRVNRLGWTEMRLAAGKDQK
jgi:hypothetical protein